LEPQIRNVAFSNDVLNQGINSESIELADSRVVFIRINDRNPPAQQALDEVSDAIIETLKQEKGREHNKLVGEQAFDALKSGKSLDDLAADWNIDLVDQGFIGRNDPALDRNLLRLAFRMKKPADGLVFDVLAHANGDYSLVELSAVISNDSDIDSERAKALSSAAAGADYQAVLKVLASRAEVVRTPLSELQ
jgi:peptidyl-prolyl cis-trans isomerase D